MPNINRQIIILFCISRAVNYGTILCEAKEMELSSQIEVSEGTTDWNFETDATTEPGEKIIYGDCGGLIELQMYASHAIEYKMDEYYRNHEQCVWTIRNPNSKNTLFIKTHSSFELNYDFLQISVFNYNTDGPSNSIKIGTTTEYETVEMTGPVVFVVFSSDDSIIGRGFRLEIHPVLGSEPYDFVFTDFFSNSNLGGASLIPYFNNMMSAFVISPNVEYNYDNSLDLDLRYNTEPSADIVRVFRLERNGGEIRYNHLGSVSGAASSSYSIYYNPCFVLIFSSDETILGNGIRFYWYSTRTTDSYFPTTEYILSRSNEITSKTAVCMH